jgi:hypothetical protein
MVVRKLAKDGADIVGIDISPRLLETAPRLEASERPGITYAEADATAPGLLEEEVFDAGACNFGLSYTAFAGSGLLVDRVAEPPAERDWADERPGTAGAPAYLVVRPLRPPSPSVWLP